MNLGAWLAEESSIRDVGVRGLPLIAIDAVSIELVISDQSHHQCSKLVCLALFEQLKVSGGSLLDWYRCGSVRIRCHGSCWLGNRMVPLLALLLLLKVFTSHQLDTLEAVVLIRTVMIHFNTIIK